MTPATDYPGNSRRKEQEFTLLVGNICQNPPMTQAKVDSDLYDVRDAKTDIVILNEIGLKRYKDAVKRILHPTEWDLNFLSKTQDPIAVRRKSNVFGGLIRSIKLNDGVKLVTPDRDLNIIKCYLEDLDEWVVIMGTHWVSGKDKIYKFRFRLRRKLWKKDWERTKQEVNYWNDLGYWVIIAGDLNDMHPQVFNRRMAWHLPGIIKVGVSPPNANTKSDLVIHLIKSDKITDVFTDKPLRTIKFKAYKRSNV